jgi:hypothetical protein
MHEGQIMKGPDLWSKSSEVTLNNEKIFGK